MSQLHDYLTGEVVEDHVDGIISRREAMRRLGLLGIGAAAATALLSASPVSAAPSATARESRRPQLVTWDTVPTQEVTLPGRCRTRSPRSKPRG